MRVVILGSGRLGSRLANALSKGEYHILIIDEDETKFKNLEEHENIQRVTGNIFNEDVATLVFSEPVDLFVAATGVDNVNIMVAQIVKKKYHVDRVLIRIFDPTLAQVFAGLGLETVCPTNFALAEMLKMIEKKSSV